MKKLVILGIFSILTLSLTGCNWFQSTAPAEEQPTVTETPTNTNVVETQDNQKSLVDYYENRIQFRANKDHFVSMGMMDASELQIPAPKDLGLQEVGQIEIACPVAEPDGICGGTLLILSKEPVKSGNQEFYLSIPGGAGYDYYGPYVDDLQRLVNESKTLGSITETY
jgi:hypothetical protein